jgi:hypothetical protein
MKNAILNLWAIRGTCGQDLIKHPSRDCDTRHKFFLIFTLVFMFLISGSAKADQKPDYPNQRDFSGAIFVTNVTGVVVSGNRFASKCAVYLDGGPGPHAPRRTRGLPDGDYYFQVTDPSGQTLLSTDPVSNRKFHVSGGVIASFTGGGGPAHPTGVDQENAAHGAITIQLANSSCPTDYLKTPNADNVYRVWVTPVSSLAGKPANVDNPCGHGCFHGFEPSRSKSDNFKAESSASTSFCLTMQSEFFDGSTTVPDLLGWGITVTDALGVANHYTTDSSTGSVTACQLSAGSYTVTQDSFDPATQTPPVLGTCIYVSPYQTILNGVVQATAGTTTFSESTQPANVTFVNKISCPQ